MKLLKLLRLWIPFDLPSIFVQVDSDGVDYVATKVKPHYRAPSIQAYYRAPSEKPHWRTEDRRG